MSDKQTKLNNTVDDFFNTPTPKPISDTDLNSESQKVEKSKIQKVEKKTSIANTINDFKIQTKESPKAQKFNVSNLVKKTIFLSEQQLDWYNDNLYKFKKLNKKTKEYDFTVFLFEQLAKTNLKL